MKINRHNYEEYFILYADNELSSDDRRLVEEFADLNPDLKDELDTYLNTVLLPDTFVGFENKEELHRYDESLISYIDNELPAAEKTEFEKLVNTTPFLQKELEFYRKTKLQPETDIVFENKSVLYRSTERKLVRMTWVRWAAAAVILLAISITAITVLNNNEPGGNKTAEVNSGNKSETQQGTPADPNKKDDATQAPKENKIPDEQNPQNNLVSTADKTTLPKEDKKPGSVTTPDEKKDVLANNNTQKATPDNSQDVQPDYTADMKRSSVVSSLTAVEGKNNVNDSYIASVDVTNRKATAFDNTEGTTIYIDEEGGQNKKSRGLFRKITRVFEMNTGIKATTDDDKLHIAAFTVKLK